MKSLSKSPNHNLNTSSLSQSFQHQQQQQNKQSARDRSPVPQLEQALADKLKAMGELTQAQKEVCIQIPAISNRQSYSIYFEREITSDLQIRSKEQDFNTKFALYEQRIQLLEMQLKEAEEREENQRKMYDKMFKAIEDSNGGSLSSRNKEQFNQSQQSLGGKEVDFMHKQVQEQLQEKVQDLEQ